MNRTSIEWTTATWNPITGCTHAGTRGCDHCYAKRMALRLAGRYGYPRKNPFSVTVHSDRLGEPAEWTKPAIVFVCSMGDLFHPDAPAAAIDDVFEVMQACRRHTFLVLTKRPENIELVLYESAEGLQKRFLGSGECLPNVWFGVTAEDQAAADTRIPLLLRTPAAKRFVSCEPLLGPITFKPRWLRIASARQYLNVHADHCSPDSQHLNWIIVGGETGAHARPMDPDWVRSIRDQAVSSEVSFFFKSWGDWAPTAFVDDLGRQTGFGAVRVGKKNAGRQLDGVEWNERPEPLS